jgi:cGMP-dependent protein kinase 2
LQDKYHLYFLFDLMPGGDLMDVLVAEAKVIRQRVPSAAWQVACLAPKVRLLFAQVCDVLMPASRHI